MKHVRIIYYTLVSIISIITALLLFAYYQNRLLSQRTHCIGNQIHIRFAKRVCEEDLNLAKGDPVSISSLENYLGKPFSHYRCPNGGKYIIGLIGAAPICTYTNVIHIYKYDFQKLNFVHLQLVHSFFKDRFGPEEN